MSIEHDTRFREFCDALADAMETVLEEGLSDYDMETGGIHICLVLSNFPTFHLETRVRQILFTKLHREDFHYEISRLRKMIRSVDGLGIKPFAYIACDYYFGKKFSKNLEFRDQARVYWLRDLAQGKQPL